MGILKENRMLRILENQTIEQAESYFRENAITWRKSEPDKLLSEVYGAALQWKMKHCIGNQWGQYPIDDVCISLIRGEL